MVKFAHPRLKRFTRKKPASWYSFYKSKCPTSGINPNKFKRIVTLLGASDYSLSEISRMCNSGNSTVIQINSVLKLRTKQEVREISKIASRAAKAIPEAELKRREAEIARILKPHKASARTAEFLAREKMISPKQVTERVRRMEEAGVPFVGLMNKIGASQKKFDGFVERYAKGGFTKRQRGVHEYLLKQGVNEKVARRVAGSQIEVFELKAKFDFFASFKLDPKVYGMERIPLKMYEGMFLDPLAVINKGIRKKILWELEDAHARRELDRLLVGWRKSRRLTNTKSGKRIRSANLLKKARALIAAGKKVTVVALASYSAETIARGTGRNLVSPSESKRRTPIQKRAEVQKPRVALGKFERSLNPEVAKERSKRPWYIGEPKSADSYSAIEHAIRLDLPLGPIITSVTRRDGLNERNAWEIAREILNYYNPSNKRPKAVSKKKPEPAMRF